MISIFEQYLNITGIIRRISEKENDDDDSKLEYGIEFMIPDDNDKLLLHAFIYEQLLNIST